MAEWSAVNALEGLVAVGVLTFKGASSCNLCLLAGRWCTRLLQKRRQHQSQQLSTIVHTPLPLLQEVESALLEAADNVRFLAPLRRHLEKFSALDDFVALVRSWGKETPRDWY